MQEDPAPEGGGADKMHKEKGGGEVKITRPKCDQFFLLAWREISSNLHCVLVLIASTLEFRKDTTHPPPNFILESYAKEEQATQLQGIEGMKEMLTRGEESGQM